MDIQYALLGMVSCRPMTGYDLKKVMQESAFMHWSGNNNQIYKALLALEDEGLVQGEVQHQEGAPSKKIYTITQEGICELKNWLKSTPEPPESRNAFLIQLICADVLLPDELTQLISGYENEVRMQFVIQQEKIRRGSGFAARTPREALLWQLADDNVLAALRTELDWIEDTKQRLFDSGLNMEESKMNYKVVEMANGRYVELFSCETPVQTVQDALDLVALCGEHDASLLMIHAAALSEEFFRLRTGVAGEILQKLVNYHIRAAAVLPDLAVMRGKFRDMAAEAGRGSQFRVFDNRQEAESWLLK